MVEFTWVDLVNTAVGLMSLVLGVFAIWLSLHFYDKAKEAERTTLVTLEAIKVQTEQLRTLNNRLLERLTRFATEPKPVDASMEMLITTVASLPVTLLAHLGNQTGTSSNNQIAQGSTDEATIGELVSCYIMLYYYCGIANIALQASLPAKEAYASNPEEFAGIRILVDMSANDFVFMKGVVHKVHVTRLEASTFKAQYDEAEDKLSDLVHDVDAHYALN